MNAQKPGMFAPALIGGAVAGVLSGIPIVGCLCCLWIIGGAMLSAYLLSKDSPLVLTSGDGAIVGAFAGIVAAVVHAILNIPFYALNLAFFRRVMDTMAEYIEELPSGWNTLLERSAGPLSLPWFFLGLIINSALYAVLGALGGIIGMALFGKKTPRPPLGTKNETI